MFFPPSTNSMQYIYDKYGIRRKWKDIRAVEKLYKLKETSGSDPWPVIEECLNMWVASAPGTWKSFLYEIDQTRETRKDQEFGSTVDNSTGATLRYTLDIPEKVVYMLRILYTPQELPMNRDFYIAFANRFPRFKIAQKM